jgi:hypothetical protein
MREPINPSMEWGVFNFVDQVTGLNFAGSGSQLYLAITIFELEAGHLIFNLCSAHPPGAFLLR